ncbi:MAG TPA: hypothetical protein VFK70_05300 [Vicinamibacteria bacterium]|nr:hypothetical protein [Vicinamibacteria bacterium]
METGQGAAIPAWLKVATAAAPTSAVRSSAVIDGFRVHPDPGDDGVIHVFDDENVVVNATDIASRPPAEPNYLVVNWGDGPNQRVGCGPCRQDHAYGPGRYTLVASLDGSGRSISVQVQVSARGPRRVRSDGPIQPFDLTNGDIGVGDTTYLVVPLLPPPTIELPVFLSIDCSPTDAADIDFLSPPLITDSTLGLPFIGVTPGTCTVSVTGTLVDGSPFAQSVTFSVH